MDQPIELTVQGAKKRDAGRGIARLDGDTCSRLGVLSGETVLLDGPRQSVTKVWPGGEPGVIMIDADTRHNAGVTIGDQLTVRPYDVAEGRRIAVELPRSPRTENISQLVKRALLDRPVRTDDQVRLDQLDMLVTVTETDPDGIVRVSEGTSVSVSVAAETDRPGWGVDSDPVPAEGATTTSDQITYEDIGGLDEELDQIREMIELPLSEPDLFRTLGIEPPKGVLLYGPPGTGKTLIAKAVANEVNANFSTISGPEIVSKYKGDSEERLRETFETASTEAPSIIFIDEIDSIAGSRDDEADMENRIVTQLLTLLDGIDSREEVIVIGATNRVDTIDPALRRGGRFDREIEIGVPDETGRREVLEVHTRGVPLAEGVTLDRIASQTHGFVGADIQTLVTEAAMVALRRYRHGDRTDMAVTRSDVETAMAAVDPSAMREYVVETPTTTFDDVGGLDDAKRTLREGVEWPLSYHELFDETNTEPPSGVLLYGPPGTGKTLLARSLAGESDVNFIHVAGPELVDKYVGESEKAIRELFERARQTAPTIIFFDEIDALAGHRGEGHEATERVVSQLLTELDGLTENPNLMVLGATNRREALDSALLRPGRLESHVEIPLPDEAARRAILGVHSAGKPYGEDVDLDELAANTADYSGAELEALVRQASMLAIREFTDDIDPADAIDRADEITITADSFEQAMDTIEDDMDT